MNYCALDDAFQGSENYPSPGCERDYSSKEARREERRKAKKCRGPPLEFLNLGNDNKDPDRQHISKLPQIPAMNPNTGLREHAPVDAPQGSLEPFLPRNDDDPVGDYVRATLPTNIPGANESIKSTSGKKKFFGADPDSEGFADYDPGASSFNLGPDFRKAFEEAGVARAGSFNSVLPNPSVNQYWKPITPSGTQTAFYEQLPPPSGEYYRGLPEKDEIMKKIDKIFARLDDLQNSSPEQATSEILMFISSGIFVLFLMDILVKKAGSMKFLKF